MVKCKPIVSPTCETICVGQCDVGHRGRSGYGVIVLQLTPDPMQEHCEILQEDASFVDQSGNAYRSETTETLLTGVERGIHDVIAHYDSLGIELGGFAVVVRKMVVHDIDSTAASFRVAARNAMAACIVNSDFKQETER